MRGHELRACLYRALFLAVILELMLVPAVLYWPQFQPNIGKIRSLTPLPMLKKMVDLVEEGGVFAYVTSQHFFKGCNILGAVGAVLFGMGAVAGEVHRGTLEMWLARPLSRRRILTERFLLGLVSLVTPIFLTTLTIPWLLERIGEPYELEPYLWSAAHFSLFTAAIYALTFLCSAVGRRPLVIAIGMIFVIILEFALYFVMEATHYSVVRMVDVEVLMRINGQRGLDPALAVPLALFTLACFVGSLLAFERRVP